MSLKTHQKVARQNQNPLESDNGFIPGSGCHIPVRGIKLYLTSAGINTSVLLQEGVYFQPVDVLHLLPPPSSGSNFSAGVATIIIITI